MLSFACFFSQPHVLYIVFVHCLATSVLSCVRAW